MGQMFDNKQSICEFLSTVIHYAEGFGVSHEKVFTGEKVIQKPDPPPLPPIIPPPV